MAVVVIDTIKPKNQGTFPVVEAADVKVTNDKRLDTALNEKANASTVEALSTAVAGKASQSDVTALQTAVAGKASQSDLTTLSNTVADKADKSALAETNTAVAGKQAALTEEQLAACNSGITSELVTQIGTNTSAIAGKADATDLETLEAEVDSKADTSDLDEATTSLQNQINNIVSGSTEDSEVINARVGDDGTSYNTLKARLDAENSALNTAISEMRNIDLGTLEDGYYINSSNGNRSSSSSYKCTDYIEINNIPKIDAYAGYNIANVGLAFYDANKQYITGYDNASGVVGTTVQLTVPSNAKYFRTCCVKTSISGFKVTVNIISNMSAKQNILVPGSNLDNTVTESSNNPVSSGAVYTSLQDKLSNEQNINLGTLDDGYYINSSTGNKSSASAYKSTDYINVEGIAKINAYAGYNMANVGIAFYDSSYNYISGYDNENGEVGATVVYAVPSNAKYFRTCCLTSAISGLKVTIGILSNIAAKQNILIAGNNLDNAVTEGSNNPVSSDAVFNSLQNKIGTENITDIMTLASFTQLLNSAEFLDGKKLQYTANVSTPEDMTDDADWTTTNIIELTWEATEGGRTFETNLYTGTFMALGYVLNNGQYVRSAYINSVEQVGNHYKFTLPESNVKLRLSIGNKVFNVNDAIITKEGEWTDNPKFGTNLLEFKNNVVEKQHLSTELQSIIAPSNPCLYAGNEFQAFKKILCVGDSLTEGTFDYFEDNVHKYFVDADYSYPTYLTALSGRETTNMGYGGDTFKKWYERYQNADLSGHDCAIIELGLNDSTSETTAEERAQYLSAIVTKLKNENNGIKIFICTILKCYSNALIPTINAELAAYAAANSNCYLLDLNTYGSTAAQTPYVAGHLTAIGYQRLAKDIYAYTSKVIANNLADFKFVQFIGTDRTYP